ncbi:efflux RND transporter permease subunit [Levilactobacillus bambusae]|uniref:Transporter n=1 Tax=Levilactobacillus bambusae TaxID=2024736 RepID=A0A2V1N0U4_9LACO|nr:hydrophobe/amphiphile efflux-3 (HAE3) family transporter [Levilactobacillus bambusae]PWG00368.1 transporter [Levilactobacillus bambusae]
MAKWFTRLGQLIHKHATLTIIVTLILTVLVGLGLPRITMDTSNGTFVSSRTKLSRDSKIYSRNFGSDTFLMDVTDGQKSMVTPDTFKKVTKFTQRAQQISGVMATTSVVDALNAQLSSETGQQSDGAVNPKLQAAMMKQLSAEQQASLQKQTTASLTAAQQQKMSAYTESLLTSTQKAQLEVAMASGGNPSGNVNAGLAQMLTKKQQAAVQSYTMALLTKQQQGQLAATMLQMLPKAQHMHADLLHELVYSDHGRVPGALKQLLPENGQHLLVTITLKGNVNQNDYAAKETQIKAALKAAGLTSNGYHTNIDGNPAVSVEIMSLMMKSMMIMLVAGVILMVVILGIVFPVRRRLLPLLFVLVGLVWTFGLMGWLNIKLTMATMATLPIIIGLGTDFGVQFLNRYEEEYRRDHHVSRAITTTMTHTGPAVLTAVVVMALSFLTMLISKAPMMQNFGVTLAIGVIVCYIVELLLMFSVLSVRDRQASPLSASDEPEKPSRLSRGLTAYATWVAKHALPIVIVGVVLGGVGFFFESRISVETDMMKMVPQDSPALKQTKHLSHLVGSTTNLTYLVSADNVQDQAVLKTMNQFGRAEVKKYGHHKIQAVTSLGSSLSQSGTLTQSQGVINRTIKKTPEVMKTTLMSSNQKYATISFRINPDLDSGQMLKLMNQISADANRTAKPAGMTIVAAGSQAMMLQGIDNMTANHGLIIIAGLLIIFMVLLLVYRNLRDALYPLVPIMIVLGLSPMTLMLLGISYNPVTVALSSLVLGIGTEFTILILERFIEEQKAGSGTLQAIQTAVGSVGQAITVSGLTVIGGFSTLMFVNFPVLNSFGLITVLDTAYSLISALTILPAIMYLFRNRSDRSK